MGDLAGHVGYINVNIIDMETSKRLIKLPLDDKVPSIYLYLRKLAVLAYVGTCTFACFMSLCWWKDL